MAGFTVGVWGSKYRCAVCQANPKMKSVWGCTKDSRMSVPTFKEIENGKLYTYQRCPVKFIPDSIDKFMEIYDYYGKYPGAPLPAFSDLCPRYSLAYRYFDAKVNQFKAEQK